MNQRIYNDLLKKVEGWPNNGLNGLLLEKEIISNHHAGQYNKDQEEYLLRTLRLKPHPESQPCPACNKIGLLCKCHEWKGP